MMMNPYYGPSTFATPSSLLEPTHHIMHPHLSSSMRRMHGGQHIGQGGNPHIQGPFSDSLFANLGRPLYDNAAQSSVNSSSANDPYAGLDLPMARDYPADSMGTPGLHLPGRDYSSPTSASMMLQSVQRSRRSLEESEEGEAGVEVLDSPLGVMSARYQHQLMRSQAMHPLMQHQHMTSSHLHIHSQMCDDDYEMSHRLTGCGSNPAATNGGGASMNPNTPCSTPSNSMNMNSSFITHHNPHHQQQTSPQSQLWSQPHMMQQSHHPQSHHHPTLTPISQQLNTSPRDTHSPPPLLQQPQLTKPPPKSEDSRQYNSSPSSGHNNTSTGNAVPFYPWMSVVGEWRFVGIYFNGFHYAGLVIA